MDKLLDSTLRWEDEGNELVPFEYFPITRTKHDKNREISVHWHRGAELTLIRQGSAKYHIDGKEYTSSAGDIFFISPNVLHSVDEIIQTSDTLVFNMDLLGFGNKDYSYLAYLQPIYTGKLKMNPHIKKTSPGYSEISNIVLSIFETITNKAPYYELRLKGLLLLLLNEFFIQNYFDSTGEKFSNTVAMEELKNILKYIHGNYNKKISIHELATKFNYSESYFMTLFKKNVGMTCIEYINYYRLKMAANQLKNSNLAITEISSENGFHNQSNFNRLFKKRMGMSPREYRKENEED